MNIHFHHVQFLLNKLKRLQRACKVMYFEVCSKWAQQHWWQTCRRHAKLSIIPSQFSFRISQIFVVFSAISLNIDELMALNTAKI